MNVQAHAARTIPFATMSSMPWISRSRLDQGKSGFMIRAATTPWMPIQHSSAQVSGG